MKQLLSQQASADVDRLIRYHRYLGEQRLASMNRYKQSLADLEQVQTELDVKLLEQTERSQVLARQTSDLKPKGKSGHGLFSPWQGNANRKRRSNKRCWQTVTACGARSISYAPKRQPWMAKPSLPPRASCQSFEGKNSAQVWGHPGGHKSGLARIDVSAPVGVNVTAVFQGKVIFSDWLQGFGLIAIVDHGDGYMTLYGHADSLSKSAGDWVEGGEVVARAGNSGGGYEPGIYFELRHKGAVQNPKQWLAP